MKEHVDDHMQRISIFGAGFMLRGTIQVGTSMEEVFKVLRTLYGASYADVHRIHEDNVLFERLGGVAGNGFYRHEAEGVAVRFRQDKVTHIMLLPNRQLGQTGP